MEGMGQDTFHVVWVVLLWLGMEEGGLGGGSLVDGCGSWGFLVWRGCG